MKEDAGREGSERKHRRLDSLSLNCSVVGDIGKGRADNECTP